MEHKHFEGIESEKSVVTTEYTIPWKKKKKLIVL
ncbi:MAG: hypothetical protein ACOX07_03020 [Methanobacterium sp.]